MSLTVTPTGSSCGAVATGIDLTESVSPEIVSELRSHWLEHKVLVFPRQNLSNDDLERVSAYFGELGDDPFFGFIEGHMHICAIQRNAAETHPVFAAIFHSDWTFMKTTPEATALYGLKIHQPAGPT